MKSIIQQIKESIQIKNITDIFTYSQLKNTETYQSYSCDNGVKPFFSHYVNIKNLQFDNKIYKT